MRLGIYNVKHLGFTAGGNRIDSWLVGLICNLNDSSLMSEILDVHEWSLVSTYLKRSSLEIQGNLVLLS
jgi:hypothetical protein